MIDTLSVVSGQAHIMVVDDEPEIAESLADFLRRKGYMVSSAITGQEALRFLEEAHLGPGQSVDLILLDMRMPQMSGLEVLEKLRSHEDTELSYTRIIMLTAASGNREKIEALNAGADDYITKPYHPQELLARVHTLLRTQQLEKQLQRQSQQLAGLNRLTNELASTLESRQVFQKTAEGMRRILNVDVAAVYLKAKQGLQCRAVDGLPLKPEEIAPVPQGQGILGQTVAQSGIFRVNTPAEEPYFAPAVDSPLADNLRNLMTVPVVIRGTTWGVLAAFDKAESGFTEFDLDLLASLSGAVSSAIENSWLVQSLQLRQQDLLDSRNTLKAIMDGILHPIYTINDNWQLAAINQSKADELEIDAEAFEGQVCYQAFFQRDTPCEHCRARQTISAQLPENWSVRWLGEDHLPQEWDIHAYPVPSKKSGSASAVIVWQDRTEERRLEQSLLQAGKLAAIGQLAAGVAHEINNPLTAINANAEMLKMVIPPEEDDYEAVDLIHRAGLRATKVVGGLLDFAREQQYTFVAIDINRSLEQALELVAYQLNVAHVLVNKELHDQLPHVDASAEHIKSVWINLLVNARDAMRDAGVEEPTVNINTLYSAGQDQIQVVIKDNGPGISEAEAAHIFEPFYTTKDPGKGTGLGLATCHRIIEQHGGKIEMISSLGAGATFIVHLPISDTQPFR